MEETNALVSVLFNVTEICLPGSEREAYYIKGALLRGGSVHIFSFLDGETRKPHQEEIFQRLISRMPINDVAVHYLPFREIQLSWFSTESPDHILFCGLVVRDFHNEVISYYSNLNFNTSSVLCVDDIQVIDNNVQLKKQMWEKWMEQFKG